MKRIYKSIMILIITLSIILLPSMVNAESGSADNNITLEGVYITSKEGKYKTGDVLEFEVRFSDEIKLPNLALIIKFGENSKPIYPVKAENQGKVLKYSYELEDSKAGKVTFESLNYGGEITTQNLKGENIKIANNVKDFKNNVNIDVNEPVWTDASKFEYTFDETRSMQISGISEIELHSYHVFFSDGKEEVKIEKDKRGKITNSYMNSITAALNIDDLLEKNGDIYISIVEEQQDNSKSEETYISKTILEKKKIEKPAQNVLTQRIYGVIWCLDDTSSERTIFVNEIHNKERKLNVFVGKVTDKSILNSIKNKESDGMSKLLNYAKNNNSESNKYVLTEQDSFGYFNSGKIIGNMTFDMNEYYYMYYVLDDENGKYTKVEDIDLLYAENLVDTPYLVSQRDSRFKWTDLDSNQPDTKPNDENNQQPNNQQQNVQKPSDTNNTEKKDETIAKDEKLPFTGEKVIAVIALMVVTIATLGITYSKINKYRGI